MNDYFVAIWSSFGLGILMAIAPCPMATNIAAISYISKRLDKTSSVLLTGLLYMFGRSLAYILLGFILVKSLISLAIVSDFLENRMNELLGPILILVGMFLLEMISLKSASSGVSEGMQKRVDSSGIWGAAFLGFIFALSFCPVSAGLFFGSLLAYAVTYKSCVVIPLVFGIGTAIPVLGFAILIAVSAQLMGKAFSAITKFEYYARRIAGGIFILVGIYYCLEFIFGIPITNWFLGVE